MITVETTLHNLNETTDAFAAGVEGIPERLFNTVPFEGSWTAGQLLCHIIKSDTSILAALKDDAIPTTTRNGDEQVAKLESLFLNFDQKLDPPDFIVPEAIDYNKEELLATFRQGRGELANVLLHTNAMETCITHPIFKDHTRLEMVWFIIVHTMRHTRQLEKIIAALEV
jgi:hypothetical protein